MNISGVNNCYGCGVCAVVCSRHIIKIKLNKDGFYEPYITDSNKCTDCGLCMDVCSYSHNDLSLRDINIKGYAAWSNEETVRHKCSSGGVSFEIALKLINKGYKVCGARYNPTNNRVEHYIAETEEDCKQSIGSKYIQSYTVDGFNTINKKEKYLVIGTPCQIDSFRRYIRRFHCEDNFVLMDFFCHGMPSYNLWEKYLKYSRINHPENIVWRNKDFGWHDSYNMIIKNTGKTFQCRATEGDLFYKYFLGHYCLGRQCVDSCRFKMFNSCADIRIGDFWGKAYQNNEEGVSAVITFTERGDELLKQSNCKVVEHPLDVVVDGQMENNACNNRQSVLFCKLLRTYMPLYIIDKIIIVQYYYTRLKDKLFKCAK